MVDATTTGNVAVNLNSKGMIGAAEAVQTAVRKITNEINGAATVTTQQLKQMADALKKVQLLQTLTSQKANKVLGDFGDNAKLGQQARALGEFRQAFDANARAADVLRGRLRAVRDEEGKLLRSGKELTSAAVLRGDRIKEAATQYNKLGNEINAVRGRIALLSDDGRKAFAPMLKSLEELDKKNAAAFSNNRRSSFGPELTTTKQMVASLKDQVTQREKLEAQSRRNLAALKEEALQITRNGVAEREARLAAAVRGGQTELRNANAIGSTRFAGAGDQTARQVALTTQLADANRRLNAEMTRPRPRVKHYDEILTQIKSIEKELGLAIALQNQFDTANSGASKAGGFFGGMKSQAKSMFGGGEDPGGNMFGAGALVTRVAGYALAASAIYGLITSIQQGIQFAVQFEDALAQLQGISGSTGLEMERLSGAILEVSKNSSSSVMELTKAATVIAQAGYAGAEVSTLLESVTKLSDASGSTADQSVDILTSALGAFQLEASESTRITDGLVAALNDSKLAVQQVQLGLQYMGAIAKENNITFEELTAVMGAAADAGIRSGSTAATGTRQLLIDLTDPSKKLLAELEKIGLTTADIDVKTLGLVEVLNRLRESGFNAYGTIETRAAAMYGVLSENTDQIDRLVAAQTRQGAADAAQEARLDSLSAKWQILLNTLSETGAILGSIVIPVVKVFVDTLTIALQIINDLLGMITSFVGYIITFGGAFGDTSVEIQSFNEALLASGLSATEAEDAMLILGDSLDDVETAAKDAQATLTALEEKERTLQTETDKLRLRQEELGGSTSSVANQVNLLSSRFPGLRAEFAKTQGGIGGLIQAMMALEDQARRTIMTQARVVLSTQMMRRNEANESARGVNATLASKIPGIQARGNLSKGDKAAAVKFNNLVQSGKKDAALDFFNSPAGSGLRKIPSLVEAARGISQYRYDYEDSNAQIGNANSTIKVGEFQGTAAGRAISTSGRVAAQAATRASSQGDQAEKDTVKAAIQKNISTLDVLEKKYANDPDILGFLGGVRSSQNAAMSELTPVAEEEKKKRAGGGGRTAANRAARDFKRVEAAIEKEEVEYRKELYENQLKAIENAPTMEALPDILQDVDDALTAYLNADKELTLKEIEANNPSDAQRGRLLAAAGRKAEELRLEQINKVSGLLSKAIKEFIDVTTKGIEQQYNEATRFAQRNVDLAGARMQGLNNPIGSNDRPEYFKTVVQRQGEIAQDRLGRAQIPANERRIGQYEALSAAATATKNTLESDLAFLGKKLEETKGTTEEIVVYGARAQVIKSLRDINQEITDLDLKTLGLKDTNEELRASYAVLNEVPTTFGAGLRTAIEAVKIDTNAASSLGQELINNLDTPLLAIREGFKGFFSDLMSGTVTVAGAFKNFAGSVIDSLLQMAAVAAANQIFSLILSAVGGSVPTPGGLGGNMGSLGSALPAGFKGPAWGGGMVKGYYGGGQIQSGLGTRDSTYVHAAKGEYIMRRSAADSIGKDTLDAMNARGASAIKGAGSPVMPVVQPAPVQTNVYVIQPDQKPQLGPNDVIAIITEDVLKGGATKKLIKQVSNG